jgi:hypothetical protein
MRQREKKDNLSLTALKIIAFSYLVIAGLIRITKDKRKLSYNRIREISQKGVSSVVANQIFNRLPHGNSGLEFHN